MDVKHDLSELQGKLTEAGWKLSKVEQRSGAYIAKGESPSGEKAERMGDTPHMALANLVRFALRNNAMQSYAKTSAWSTNWLGKHEEIAKDYRKLPVFDKKAVPAYTALAEESAQQAAEIRKQVHVEIVSEEHPYKSASEMRDDVHKNRHLSISKASLDHPIWTPDQVLDFRIVHDVIGHAQGGGEFSWRGQNIATAAHMPHVSPLARQALFTQTIGQASEYKAHKMFGPPRVGLMKHWVEPASTANGEHLDVPYMNTPHVANEHGFTNDETMALAIAIEHKPELRTKAMSIMTLAPATIEAWLRQVADVLDTELGIDASKVDMAQVIGGLETDAAKDSRRDGHTFQQGDRVVYDGSAFAGETMGTIEEVLKSPNLMPGIVPQPYQYRLRVRLDNGHIIPDTQGDSVKVMPKGPDGAPDTLPEGWHQSSKTAATWEQTHPEWFEEDDASLPIRERIKARGLRMRMLKDFAHTNPFTPKPFEEGDRVVTRDGKEGVVQHMEYQMSFMPNGIPHMPNKYPEHRMAPTEEDEWAAEPIDPADIESKQNLDKLHDWVAHVALPDGTVEKHRHYTLTQPTPDTLPDHWGGRKLSAWVPAVGDTVMLKPGIAKSLGIKPKDPRWEADMDSRPEGQIIEILPASQRQDGTMGWPLFKVKGDLITGLLVRQEQMIPLQTSQDSDAAPEVPDTLPQHWTKVAEYKDSDKVRKLKNKLREGVSAARMGKYALQIDATKAQLKKAIKEKPESFREKALDEYTKLKKGGAKAWTLLRGAGIVEDVPESDLPEDWIVVVDDEPINRHPGRADRVSGWAEVTSKTAALAIKLSGVLQSHMIRHAYRLAGSKVDKLAEKARLQLWKRPDLVKWVEEQPRSADQLKDFFANAPSEAFKLYPWMWTQIRGNPSLMSADHNFAGRMYEIGTAFHALGRANRSTPDIHRLDYAAANDWYQNEAKPLLEDLKPMEWKDPKHHLTLSDKRHVIHQITNAKDATQEGDVMGHCFPAGTLVQAQVPTPIDKLVVGDEVMGHDGRYHTVTEVMERDNSEDLIVINSRGTLPIRCTPEHPILVLRPARPKRQAMRQLLMGERFPEGLEPQWVEAKDVRAEDRLVAPAPAFDTMDVPEAPFDASDDLSWLVGIYVGDGGIHKRNRGKASAIQITMSATDDYERVARTVGTSFGLKTKVVDHETYKRVGVNSTELATTLEHECGRNSSTKRLPAFLFGRDWNIDEALAGLLAADGHYSERDEAFIFISTSLILAQQVRMLALLAGKSPSLHSLTRHSGYSNAKPSWKVQWKESGAAHSNRWINGWFTTEVTDVSSEAHAGMVYNIEVEDVHTYLVNGVVVHNCVGGYGPQIENGSTNIFSVRDDKHKPHVTIEMQPVDKPQRKTYDDLNEGDRILVGDRTYGPVMGATILARGPDWGEYTIQSDDAHNPSKVSVNHVRGYYPGRFKAGDMVMPLYKPQWLDMSKAPFRVNSIHIGESSIGYHLDTAGAADNSNAYMDETHLTAEDGSIPDKPEMPTPLGQELPTEHRVTQVFGKGDQAPIAKYRKMTREFFDHLRAQGHTLHWAGNEFLPDEVSSVAEAEVLFEFLDDLQDHMNDSDSRGEPEPHIDALGMGHSLIETGAMAHQYGFDDVDPEVMQVDWDRLLEDYGEQMGDTDESSANKEEITKWVIAVGHVKGLPDVDIKQKLQLGRNSAQDKASEKMNEEACDARSYNWGEIQDHAREINRDEVDRQAKAKGLTVDHDERILYHPDHEDGEYGGVKDEHRDDAESSYSEMWDDSYHDSEQSADDAFIENYESESESDYDYDEHFDALEGALDSLGPSVRNLIDDAMNPKADDKLVNSRWATLLSKIGTTPEDYAKKTHSMPNRAMEAYKMATAEIQRLKPAQGWQQQMPKGEEPVYDISERTEQILDAMKMLALKAKTTGGPKVHTTRDTHAWAEQHSLHAPIHSVTPAPKPATGWTPRPNSNPGPAQRDMVFDHANDTIRPGSPLKSVDGEGLIAGDVVEHPQYGRGTVEGVGTNGFVNLHFPTNGTTHGPIEDHGGIMKRVGSWTEVTAADEWDHPEAWTGQLDPDDTTTFIIAADYNADLGGELRQEVSMGHWDADRLREIASRHDTDFNGVTLDQIDWDHVGMHYEEEEHLEDDEPTTIPNAVPTGWVPQSDNPQQMEDMVRGAGWVTVAAEHEREEDPESIFIYYMGELRMEPWHHNRRYKELTKDFFEAHGSDVTDFAFMAGVDEHDMALGVAYRDGEVEHHQLTRPEIREEAEEAITVERAHPEGDAAPPSPALPAT